MSNEIIINQMISFRSDVYQLFDGTYISRFFNRFEIARRSAWADAVSSNIDINQLGNSDNADTCIKHNAKIFIIAGSIFYENKRSLKVKGRLKNEVQNVRS